MSDVTPTMRRIPVTIGRDRTRGYGSSLRTRQPTEQIADAQATVAVLRSQISDRDREIEDLCALLAVERIDHEQTRRLYCVSLAGVFEISAEIEILRTQRDQALRALATVGAENAELRRRIGGG